VTIKFCATAENASHVALDRESDLTAAELDAPGATRTMVSVPSSASDGDAPKGITTLTERRWIRWPEFWRHADSESVVNTDAIVAAWKAAWMKGAQAAWETRPAHANPHATGQERSAWDAGWRWAQQNPDRRNHGTPRLAHRHRRALDSTGPLTRALQLGAVGVTVFWVSRALHRWARGTQRES
jgi:hypothetical protein